MGENWELFSGEYFEYTVGEERLIAKFLCLDHKGRMIVTNSYGDTMVLPEHCECFPVKLSVEFTEVTDD